MRYRIYPSLWILIVCGAVYLEAGCGQDDGIGTRYRARGVVKYRGGPVPVGTVTFTPEGSGRAATGELSEDGSFTLTTHSQGDGALPGKYRVTVVSVEGDRSKLPRVGPGIPLIDRKHRPVMKDLVPKKYGSPWTTPLKEEVKPQSNSFEFSLED